ncbi:cell division protein FtsB [Thalassotalea sp. HSM 43]|uniref:cell division protein FtsB n=1 Tax=Thalassotalea sp. HSM 43 TaxID=2552945 RepID=UPI00108168DB|nr:cell division protein FtsB [Thalassotalea sp. HSM 43]QBY06215.1 cell division protein FtsB [Thalassotalea sp. HSM 43]
MRIITAILVLFFILLQYRLWFGKNSVPDYWQQVERIEAQQQINEKLSQRNQLVWADIKDLRHGLEAVEERARNELGMIKDGETFIRVIPQEK